ncbi:MAG: crotonobetainyl-CoA--carnitine CoA-transferase [Magnetococcus sp. THC-1_WYH]
MTNRSQNSEKEARNNLQTQLKNTPVPKEEQIKNLGLFMDRQTWSHYLFLLHLYREILPIHGHIMEFGVRWGRNMAVFTALRGVFEPFNYIRKIIGFDTFSGFPGVHEKDGTDGVMRQGAYGVMEGYESVLADILDTQEALSPIQHIRKFELVKGDVTQTLTPYLEKHPETIVALAYFDLDIYQPTRHCLERVLPLMPKGAIVAFDELNDSQFPGESIAMKEVMGMRNHRLQRLSFAPRTSFIVLD